MTLTEALLNKAYPTYELEKYLIQWFGSHDKASWYRWANELPVKYKAIPLIIIVDMKNQVIGNLGL